VGEEQRLGDYGQMRLRIMEHLRAWEPDVVAIADLEPYALKMRRASLAMFRTAELRGVLAEASHSSGVETLLRTQKAIGEDLGTRSAGQYHADDAFWDTHVGSDFLKKYRDAVLLALSCIRRKT
jgi:hypothetical protein